MERRKNVLLGLCGSVATVKFTELVIEISKFANVRVVWTEASSKFDVAAENYKKEFFEQYDLLVRQGIVVSYVDQDEWDYDRVGTDPVVHIELRKWADLFLVAPLSANTLAKLANGLSDNLLTSVARAWDLNRPFLVAPAMNTFMWDHPLTAKHLETIQEFGIQVIEPMSKTLACGDVGKGALAKVPDIIQAVASRLSPPSNVVAEQIQPTEKEHAYHIIKMEPTHQPRIGVLLKRHCPSVKKVQWDPDSGTCCTVTRTCKASNEEYTINLKNMILFQDKATRVICGFAFAKEIQEEIGKKGNEQQQFLFVGSQKHLWDSVGNHFFAANPHRATFTNLSSTWNN